MFYFEKIHNKKILKSDLISGANAFFTTRNTILKSTDENMLDLIGDNKKTICKYLNIEEQNLVSPIQTHSLNIEIVQDNKTDYPDTDGLILTDKNKAIFLNFADCTPLIFYDEKQNIGAISHAGWRGTAGRIGVLTVEKMVNELNSKKSDLKVLIGPAISECCYNVGEDVFEKLKESVNNFENLYKIKENKIYVDLKNINKTQLTEIGVEKIDICPYCTYCDNDNFYSYRKENATSNRHSAVLSLCKET